MTRDELLKLTERLKAAMVENLKEGASASDKEVKAADEKEFERSLQVEPLQDPKEDENG